MKVNNSLKIQNTNFTAKPDKKFIANCPDVSNTLKKLPQDADFYKKYNNLQVDSAKLFKKIKELNIPNLQQINDKGFRGESLSAEKNQKFLKQIKNYGINTIIDLRTADYTEKYSKRCQELGFKFYHIPIDSKIVSDREIINSLPILFERMEKGNFYIACAQGKHRTDIAIALNYLFNPKYKGEPPVMYGHVENGKMRIQDIFTRANSIYKELTTEDKAMLGWNKEFEEGFKQRKINLREFNER